MKKIVGLMLIVSTSVCAVFAQVDTKDAKAKSILAQVSKKYRSYNTVKADFTYTLDNLETKTKESQTGTIYLKPKTNKYKVVLKDQDLLSDGKLQWTYLKEDKEVQLSEVDNTSDALNPAKIFTVYETGFKYVYIGDVKLNGKLCYTIDLSPTDTKRSYFKIRLIIDQATKNISSATIFDKNGSRYTYGIKTFAPNVSVAETTFTFDKTKYPGVEVVDLR